MREGGRERVEGIRKGGREGGREEVERKTEEGREHSFVHTIFTISAQSHEGSRKSQSLITCIIIYIISMELHHVQR